VLGGYRIGRGGGRRRGALGKQPWRSTGSGGKGCRVKRKKVGGAHFRVSWRKDTFSRRTSHGAHAWHLRTPFLVRYHSPLPHIAFGMIVATQHVEGALASSAEGPRPIEAQSKRPVTRDCSLIVPESATTIKLPFVISGNVSYIYPFTPSLIQPS
jgi:hypothetical protein